MWFNESVDDLGTIRETLESYSHNRLIGNLNNKNGSLYFIEKVKIENRRWRSNHLHKKNEGDKFGDEYIYIITDRLDKYNSKRLPGYVEEIEGEMRKVFFRVFSWQSCVFAPTKVNDSRRKFKIIRSKHLNHLFFYFNFLEQLTTRNLFALCLIHIKFEVLHEIK